MDDERLREGVKLDLTAREDNYLSTKFFKLSSSGHDITPMSEDDKRNRKESSQQPFEIYLGHSQRGIYTCKVGGLPLFASGFRVDNECNENELVFLEPCDSDHISLKNNNLYCSRSGLKIGYMSSPSTITKKYIVFCNQVRFYAINSPWPIESQPENYWGSEGQYRAWNEHELDAHPLSY
eukprot:gene12088-25343_t